MKSFNAPEDNVRDQDLMGQLDNVSHRIKRRIGGTGDFRIRTTGIIAPIGRITDTGAGYFHKWAAAI